MAWAMAARSLRTHQRPAWTLAVVEAAALCGAGGAHNRACTSTSTSTSSASSSTSIASTARHAASAPSPAERLGALREHDPHARAVPLQAAEGLLPRCRWGGRKSGHRRHHRFVATTAASRRAGAVGLGVRSATVPQTASWMYSTSRRHHGPLLEQQQHTAVGYVQRADEQSLSKGCQPVPGPDPRPARGRGRGRWKSIHWMRCSTVLAPPRRSQRRPRATGYRLAQARCIG